MCFGLPIKMLTYVQGYFTTLQHKSLNSQDAVLSGTCVAQQSPFGHLPACNDKKMRVITFLQRNGIDVSHCTSSYDATADPTQNFSVNDVRMGRPENSAIGGLF